MFIKTIHGLTLSAVISGLCLNQAGANPEPYGEHFIRWQVESAVAQPTEITGTQPLGMTATTERDVSQYEQQLLSEEQRNGPYEDSLAEPLTRLGDHYRQQGDFDKALSHYRRALHIVRLNDGLYSERQLPILASMLASFRALQNFQTLDDRYQYFFRLYGHGEPPYNDLKIKATLEYMRWQREAFQRGLDGDGRRRLLSLISLNEEVLASVVANSDSSYSWIKALSYSQISNYYLLLQHHTPSIIESSVISSRDYMGMKPMAEDFETKRIDSKLRTANNDVSTILEHLETFAKGQSLQEQAEIELAEADWYWWNNERHKAIRSYQQVEQILQQAELDRVLDEWLGQPVELPSIGAFSLPGEEGREAQRVNAKFNVSSRGRVSNIELQPLDEGEANLTRFKRRLANTLFRPAWSTGEPVAVNGLQREYQLLNQ